MNLLLRARLLARLERYARAARAQIARHIEAGRRHLALVWLEIAFHVRDARRKLGDAT